MTVTDCDAIVIGAGQPGPGVAGWLAEKGKQVVLIEMEKVGGTCLNHGCKPTKALRASAAIAQQVRRAGEYGVRVGEPQVDFPAAMDRVWSIIDEMRDSLSKWIDSVDNLELIQGAGQLVTDPEGVAHRVQIGDRELRAPEVYLNLGARAAVPPVPGLDSVSSMTEVELLAPQSKLALQLRRRYVRYFAGNDQSVRAEHDPQSVFHPKSDRLYVEIVVSARGWPSLPVAISREG